MAALVKEAVTDVIDKERHGVREGSGRIDINERLMARAVGMTKKPANQQVLERILRFRDIPESMPASVSFPFHSLGSSLLHASQPCVSVCASRRSLLFWDLSP